MRGNAMEHSPKKRVDENNARRGIHIEARILDGLLIAVTIEHEIRLDKVVIARADSVFANGLRDTREIRLPFQIGKCNHGAVRGVLWMTI